MTLDERVRALDPLGFTPRQTRFLVTVALHGGYCLRRHYTTFAGVRYGKNVRTFLDGLVARGFARRARYQAHRGYVYHLCAKGIYRAIAQRDHANRREASPVLIAQKLMLLDHVLSQPQVEWFAAEEDKVELFTRRFGVPLADLPQRTYDSFTPQTTTRYFIHKLPIALAGDPPAVQLVFLATAPGGDALATFLRNHACLLRHLPSWTVVAVAPAHVTALPACQSVFERFMRSSEPLVQAGNVPDLRRAFDIRHAFERDDLAPLGADDLSFFGRFRPRLAMPPLESLYAHWLERGDAAFSDPITMGCRGDGTGKRLVLRSLPHTYGQFGTMAGVA